MSVRLWGINIFKTRRLRDHWAHVDETWHVYSMGNKLAEFWISARAPHGATPNLARSLSPIPYTELCTCIHAASEQRRYAEFYVGKIPVKNLIDARKFPASNRTKHAGREGRPTASGVLIYLHVTKFGFTIHPQRHVPTGALQSRGVNVRKDVLEHDSTHRLTTNGTQKNRKLRYFGHLMRYSCLQKDITQRGSARKYRREDDQG